MFFLPGQPERHPEHNALTAIARAAPPRQPIGKNKRQTRASLESSKTSGNNRTLISGSTKNTDNKKASEVRNSAAPTTTNQRPQRPTTVHQRQHNTAQQASARSNAKTSNRRASTTSRGEPAWRVRAPRRDRRLGYREGRHPPRRPTAPPQQRQHFGRRRAAPERNKQAQHHD